MDFKDFLKKEKEEIEILKKEREEYLKNTKEDFTFSLKGFHFVKDGQIPQEFEQCICIWKINDKYEVLLGIWDESMMGCHRDERGSFFDGIGGHFLLDEIIAWCPIDKYILEKIKK